MNQVKEQIEKHMDKFKFVLLIGAAIAVVNTLCRADYNFIIYLYMYYVWQFFTNSKESQSQEKVSCFFICIYSLLIDLIWCFYWSSKWGSMEEDNESGVHALVKLLSWIGILVKILVIAMVGLSDWETIKVALPAKLQQKFNAAGGYGPQIDEVMG